MQIGVGCDHHGSALTATIRDWLSERGHQVRTFGDLGPDPVDYPDIAVEVAGAVASGAVDRAVLVCGTGLGMAIAANKVRGVRAVSVSDPYSAERAIRSNNAQVLCLGALVVGPELAKLLVEHWIDGEFSGGDSARKVAKIDELDRAAISPA